MDLGSGFMAVLNVRDSGLITLLFWASIFFF